MAPPTLCFSQGEAKKRLNWAGILFFQDRWKTVEQASISCSRKYASQVIYQKKFGKYRGFCVRFDGRLGFPGGLLDPGESIETALNRFKKQKKVCKGKAFLFKQGDIRGDGRGQSSHQLRRLAQFELQSGSKVFLFIEIKIDEKATQSDWHQT